MPSPLLPQYSLRWLLLVTTACAVLFSVFGFAVQGNKAAIGISVAVLSLGLLLVVFALAFLLLWIVSLFWGQVRWRRKGNSPFAAVAESSLPEVTDSATTAIDDRCLDDRYIDDKDIPGAPMLLE